jgi:hypothetical protein
MDDNLYHSQKCTWIKNASRKGPELSMTATLISHQPGQPKRISFIGNISPNGTWPRSTFTLFARIGIGPKTLIKHFLKTLWSTIVCNRLFKPCLFYFTVHYDCETLFIQLNTVVRSNCQGTQHFNIYCVAQSS